MSIGRVEQNTVVASAGKHGNENSILTLPNADDQTLTVRAKALVFEDPASLKLLRRIEQVAPSDATVLVTGETGTGKEIVARHLHDLSRRARAPFVGVNCGAFSDMLVESELFGHERGAFTGATGTKAGWFEVAQGGTLFLDEIGDLPLPIQVKLLRVLQEDEVVRVGSTRPIATDVRLIAATNVNLAEAMDAGHFREDLFYRLNVTTIDIPALRERPGDIIPLAEYFLEHYARRLAAASVELRPNAIRALLEHPWPGNIRELENAMHHALLVCADGKIGADDLRLASRSPRMSAPAVEPVADDSLALERALLALFESKGEGLFELVERTLFTTAYEYCDENQLQTARLLGISRNVVRARLMQYGKLQASLRHRSLRAAESRLDPNAEHRPNEQRQ